MPQNVTKKDGRIEPFIKEKIVVSAVKSGAHADIARKIAEKIEKKPEENIKTSKIRDYVIEELNHQSTPAEKP